MRNFTKDLKPCKKVNRRDTKTEALIKATERNREELKKSWQKVEELEAAIQSAKSGQLQRKRTKKPN
jgi:hypothetical protein